MPALRPLAVSCLVTACVAVTAVGSPLDAGATQTTSAAAVHWYQQVLSRLRPLQSPLVGGLEAASAWAKGSETAQAAGRALGRDLPPLERAERSLQAMTPLAGDAAAGRDDAAAVQLYVDALEVERAATELPTGAVVVQLQRCSERIRELGDATFDQVTARLAPLLGQTLTGADVAAAAHLPDWASTGLAPGPPLVTSWDGAPASNSGTTRAAAWPAVIGTNGAPSQAALHDALVRHATAAMLAHLATQLGRSVGYLETVQIPAADRSAANLLELGLLVDTEAVLTAEAGRLVHGAPARALASVGNDLSRGGSTLRAQG